MGPPPVKIVSLSANGSYNISGELKYQTLLMSPSPSTPLSISLNGSTLSNGDWVFLKNIGIKTTTTDQTINITGVTDIANGSSYILPAQTMSTASTPNSIITVPSPMRVFRNNNGVFELF
jgi:hypothetical protein